MCRSQRRAARHGAYSVSNCSHHGRNQFALGGFSAIVSALEEIKLANRGIDSRANLGTSAASQMHQFEPQLQGTERGIAHDYVSAADEKITLQQQQIQFEELPTYEETIGTRSENSQPPILTPAASVAGYDPAPQQPISRPNGQMMVIDNLETFRKLLLAYRHGAPHAKNEAKRVATGFVRDLYAQEIANRTKSRGYLECGERKQIKTDLKPLKQMLKAAVLEVKRERRGK